MVQIIDFNPNDAGKIVHGGLVSVAENPPDQDIPYEPYTSDPFGGFDEISVGLLITVDDASPSFDESLFTLARTSDGQYIMLERRAGSGTLRLEINTNAVTQIDTVTNLPAVGEATWVWCSFNTNTGLAGVVSGLTRTENTGTNTRTYPTGGFDEMVLGGFRTNGGAVSAMFNGTIHEMVIHGGGLLAWHERRQIYNGADPVEVLEGIGNTVYRHWILNDATDKKNSITLSTLHGSPNFSDGGCVYLRNRHGSQHFGCTNNPTSADYHEADLSGTGFQALWDQDDYSLTAWYGTLATDPSVIALSDGTASNRETVELSANNNVSLRAEASGAGTTWSATGVLPVDDAAETFYPVTLRKKASNDRECYAVGAFQSSESTDRDNAGLLDTLQINARGDGGGGSDGRNARIAIHSPALTPDQIALIHAGADPTEVGTCIAYWSLSAGVLTEQMGLGAGDLVANGSAGVEATRYVANPQPALRQLNEAFQPPFDPNGLGTGFGGVFLDGTSDYMESAILFPWFPGDSNWTFVGVWNAETPYSSSGVSISGAQEGDEDGKKNNLTWTGSLPGQNTVQWRVDDGFGVEDTIGGPQNWTEDVVTISVKRDGSDIEVSMDGTRQNTGLITADPEGAFSTIIGADQTTGGTLTAYWHGVMGSIRLFVDEALTDGELSQEESEVNQESGNVKLNQIHPILNLNKRPHPYALRARPRRYPEIFHVSPPQTAGTPVDKFFHFSRPVYPHPYALRAFPGKFPDIFHFTPAPVAGTPIDKYFRFKKNIGPHPQLLRGKAERFEGFSLLVQEYCQIWEQKYRVADDSFDLYELYVGEDGSPDFDDSAQPVATSASLPFTWTPTTLPASGSTLELHIVVRRRNQYDLQSFNVYEKILTIDSVGAEVLGPVSPPRNVAVYDTTTGNVKVFANYTKSDDTNPADTWEVYAVEGSDPVIGVDPALVDKAMEFFGEDAVLDADIGPFTPGATLHVLVVSKRASDDERASAAVVQHVLLVSLDLDAGQIFGGSQYEQR